MKQTVTIIFLCNSDYCVDQRPVDYIINICNNIVSFIRGEFEDPDILSLLRVRNLLYQSS